MLLLRVQTLLKVLSYWNLNAIASDIYSNGFANLKYYHIGI